MLIAFLLFLVCLLLYLSGAIQPLIVLACLIFSILYLIFELYRQISLKKTNEKIRHEERGLLSIPLTHISGLNVAKMQIIYLIMKSPDQWILSINGERLELSTDQLVAIWVMDKQALAQIMAEEDELFGFKNVNPDFAGMIDTVKLHANATCSGLLIIETKANDNWNKTWVFRPQDTQTSLKELKNIEGNLVKYPRLYSETVEGDNDES